MTEDAPRQPIIVFLSAVSAEFHHTDPRNPTDFRSYRVALSESLRAIRQPHTIIASGDLVRRADPAAQPGHLAVVSQENLAQGFGDLLESLEYEIQRATVIVHLIGDMTGVFPEDAPVDRLRIRHPQFLAHMPGLRASLGDLSGFSYTQWEIYLGFHHSRLRLVFIASDTAQRSPLYVRDEAQIASQLAHLARIKDNGKDRDTFSDRDELVQLAIRSLDRYGLIAKPPAKYVTAEAIAAALERLALIIVAIAAAIRKPDPVKVPMPDRAGVAVWLSAVDTVAADYGLNRSDILRLLEDQRDKLVERARQQPVSAILLELAQSLLALVEYRSCIAAATRAAELATPLISSDPDHASEHREHAINAHLLIRDAAFALHDRAAAISAVERGAMLIDKEQEPVFWADFHEPLADYCIEQEQWQRADELISDILDIREEHQGENHPALANTLLNWSDLLLHTGKYQGACDVARRAGQIFATQTPPDLLREASAISNQGVALLELGRLADAEPLIRRALAIAEASLGPKHPRVTTQLNNLARLLQDTNRLAQAEPMMRRALAIDEANFGPEHSRVAIPLNNLARLLHDTNRLAEAEPMMRRALAINEASFGPEHSRVAAPLNNLARLLQDTNRLAEAEPLFRRALAIDEASLGPEHPRVASHLGNLARLLQDTNRLAEAEPLMRRALAIDEASFGPEHPRVAIHLGNLARLLQDTNRLAEAEPMMRRALAIDEARFGPDDSRVATHLSHLVRLLQDTNRLAEAEPLMRRALAINESSFGPDHSRVATHLSHLARLLHDTNRLAEAEPLMRRMVLIFLKFTRATGQEHPDLRGALADYAMVCQQMAVPENEIWPRLFSLCAEAGLDEARTQEILRAAFPPP